MGNWITDIAGWEPRVSVIETCWFMDPAVDQEKSDKERYYKTLEMDSLVIKPGWKPVKLVVNLTEDAAQITELKMLAFGSTDTIASAVRAFSMCVRFPDLEEPAKGEPVYSRQNIGGTSRIPASFMTRLARDTNGDMMVVTIGCWIIQKSVLDDMEKKTSSPLSTKKTSGTDPEELAPTGASTSPLTETKSDVATKENASTDVQNSEQPQDQKQKAG